MQATQLDLFQKIIINKIDKRDKIIVYFSSENNQGYKTFKKLQDDGYDIELRLTTPDDNKTAVSVTATLYPVQDKNNG